MCSSDLTFDVLQSADIFTRYGQLRAASWLDRKPEHRPDIGPNRESAMAKRSFVGTCALIVACCVAALAPLGTALAQSQITVVVTVAAGGSSDIGLRTIATKNQTSADFPLMAAEAYDPAVILETIRQLRVHALAAPSDALTADIELAGALAAGLEDARHRDEAALVGE